MSAPMAATSATQRPRPLILGLLAVTVAVVVIWAVWPAASQPPSPSNQRDARRADGQGTAGRGSATRPGDLEVRLEALRQPPAPTRRCGAESVPVLRAAAAPSAAAAADTEAGRQRLRGPAAAAAPGAGHARASGLCAAAAADPAEVHRDPGSGGRKTAIFSDGRGLPLYAKEGELVLGQFRIVRIGVESIVMEYADGTRPSDDSHARRTIDLKAESCKLRAG